MTLWHRVGPTPPCNFLPEQFRYVLTPVRININIHDMLLSQHFIMQCKCIYIYHQRPYYIFIAWTLIIIPLFESNLISKQTHNWFLCVRISCSNMDNNILNIIEYIVGKWSGQGGGEGVSGYYKMFLSCGNAF